MRTRHSALAGPAVATRIAGLALAGLVALGLATAAKPSAPSTASAMATSPELARVHCGVDVLAARNFDLLAGERVGLITNHTGLLRDGRRTVDVLHAADDVDLVALFAPEHGFEGALDREDIADSEDAATGLVVHSLYGRTRRPTAKMLAGLDVLVFDIQDIGCRFYTYVSTLGLALEAAAEHGVAFVVLDRPVPLGGDVVEGPVLDPGRRSFVGFHEIPVRHGMTVGELARMFAAERELDVDLEVVPAQGWERRMLWCDTDLVFTAASPNIRRPSQALLYPGVGLLEFTNISVGRGTDTPFERIGAPWIDGPKLARLVAAHELPGVVATAVRFVPESSVHAGASCGGVDLFVTDWRAVRPLDLGLVLAACLRDGFEGAWDDARFDRLLGDADTLRDVREGVAPEVTRARWAREVAAFRTRRAAYLIYE